MSIIVHREKNPVFITHNIDLNYVPQHPLLLNKNNNENEESNETPEITIYKQMYIGEEYRFDNAEEGLDELLLKGGVKLFSKMLLYGIAGVAKLAGKTINESTLWTVNCTQTHLGNEFDKYKTYLKAYIHGFKMNLLSPDNSYMAPILSDADFYKCTKPRFRDVNSQFRTKVMTNIVRGNLDTIEKKVDKLKFEELYKDARGTNKAARGTNKELNKVEAYYKNIKEYFELVKQKWTTKKPSIFTLNKFPFSTRTSLETEKNIGYAILALRKKLDQLYNDSMDDDETSSQTILTELKTKYENNCPYTIQLMADEIFELKSFLIMAQIDYICILIKILRWRLAHEHKVYNAQEALKVSSSTKKIGKWRQKIKETLGITEKSLKRLKYKELLKEYKECYTAFISFSRISARGLDKTLNIIGEAAENTSSDTWLTDQIDLHNNTLYHVKKDIRDHWHKSFNSLLQNKVVKILSNLYKIPVINENFINKNLSSNAQAKINKEKLKINKDLEPCK